MARVRRKQEGNASAVLLVLFLLACAATWLVGYWGRLNPHQRLAMAGVGMLGITLVALPALLSWQARRHQRAAYALAIAEFRWRPGMTPTEFETCCADYLAGRGWRARTTARTGDQGIDVLAERRRVRLVLQCKLYGRPVGNKAVQEALAGRVFAGATHAAVVSNQGYTKSARELAARTGVQLLHFTDLARADELFPS